MGKRVTLKERARAYAGACPDDPYGEPLVADAWLAGHRANRISAAERRVVEAAKAIIKNKRADGSYIILTVDCARLAKAFENLQRAKGGANG